MPGPFCDFETRRPHRLEKIADDRVRCQDCGEEFSREELANLVKAGILATQKGSSCGGPSADGPASTERPERPERDARPDAPAPGALIRKRPPPVV